MMQLQRIQVRFHCIEGEVVTTTRVQFGRFTSEFLTLSSISFLMGHPIDDLQRIARENRLIMREKNGQEWLEIFDALKLINLLSA